MRLNSDFFLKNRLAVMNIARDFLVTEVGDQIKTINDYVQQFDVARGTIQAALSFLTTNGCVATQFKGQYGTTLVRKNQKLLWHYSGLGRLLGALSLPFSPIVSGLATGICASMTNKNIDFNFAFVTGSDTRLWGLEQNKYEFVVASNLTWLAAIDSHPQIQKVMELEGSQYTSKFVLVFADQESTEIKDGMTVVYDPTSLDQVYLTTALIKGKKVKHFTSSYIRNFIELFRGSADVGVLRLEGLPEGVEYREVVLPKMTPEDMEQLCMPAIFALKDNYGIDRIIRYSLDQDLIAQVQRQVVADEIPPNYF